jgi:ubiquitin-protein ligase
MYHKRHERLLNDRRLMEELAASSSIVSFEAAADAPDRYTLIFHGKGPTTGAQGRMVVSEEHRCLLHLPFSYPDAGPDVQWLTPLLHPNVGYGGFMQLEDIGLDWHADMGLDVVCERLWDIARLAYINDDAAVNSSAIAYFATATWHLPLDERPLRDRVARQVKNVVRYKRRPGTVNDADSVLQIGDESAGTSRRANDVLFIGDEEAE